MAEFDLAVIGAGSAGLSVAAVAAQLGLRVALIERERMGGDCLNAGCVPSKALLAASHAALDARAAGRFGVRLAAPAIDWGAVRGHVQGVIDALAPADSVERFTGLGVTVLLGHACFVSRDALGVDLPEGRRLLSARRIVIATGSRAAIPDIPGLADTPHVTHAGIFGLQPPPRRLLILGGGPIGLEMAQAHVGLGCQVTVVEAGRVAGREDPELAGALAAELRAQGVTILEQARITRVEPGPALVLEGGMRLVGSDLLVAAGRRPNIEALGLDAGHVAAGPRGVATDRGLRSRTNARVYAIGDVADVEGVGPLAFTHLASHHAGVVIRRAAFRLPARADRAVLPRVTYTAPELAQVGLTEAEARAAGHDVRVLRWELAENDRAQAGRQTGGLVKLVATRRGRLLGAGILAPHAGEMIGVWTLALAQRTRLSALAGMIVPYPTLAEAGKRAAGSYFAGRLFSPFTRRLVRLLAWLP